METNRRDTKYFKLKGTNLCSCKTFKKEKLLYYICANEIAQDTGYIDNYFGQTMYAPRTKAA